MPKKKKPFLDKKSAQTFFLVQREVEEASQENTTEEELKAQRVDEQHKFGVYFTDDYDYMQHLRDPAQKRQVGIRDDVPTKSQVTIPGTELGPPEPAPPTASETFALGLDDGLFPAEAEKIDEEIDPEVVLALEEEKAADDLEDDFMQLAQGDDPDYLLIDEYSGDDELDDADEDNSTATMIDWLRGVDAEVQENYGESTQEKALPIHTRSVPAEAADQRFEELMREYESDESSDISEGGMNFESEAMVAYMKQARELVNTGCLKELVEPGRQHVRLCDLRDSDQEEFEYVLPETKSRPKFDAVSIISTYSNTQNLPTMIETPKNKKKVSLSQKTGLPLDVLPRVGPTRRQQEQLEHEMSAVRLAPSSGFRPAGETPEERRQRKAAVKEDRRYRRMEKKQNKVAFKAEKIRQERAQASQPVQVQVKL